MSANAARRKFIDGLLALGTLAIAGPARSVSMPGARGSAQVDVREHGAKGDGSSDDTAAFQAAIDALPASGGTVRVPAGNYLIDPARSVRLRSRMRLAMEGRARLIARSNALDRAYVLLLDKVGDVEISGGQIVGERDTHMGTTGEWGHGLMIRSASRVSVSNLRISKCWGDGISIGGSRDAGGAVVPSNDVSIDGVVCDGNRRQGLTIGRSRNVRVSNSQFINTGGTKPGAGIDVEPDGGEWARQVDIENCQMRGNAGPGVSLSRRVSGVTIRNCTIADNREEGVFMVGVADCTISGNSILRNGLYGINLRRDSQNVRVSGNRISGNGSRRMPVAKQGAAKTWGREVQVVTETRGIQVAADNRYD